MKPNIVRRVAEAIELIVELTDSDITETIDALTGTALSEEDAGEIKAYLHE